MGQQLSELDRCCNMRDDPDEAHNGGDGTRSARRKYDDRVFVEPDETLWDAVPGNTLRLEVRLFNRTRIEDDLVEMVDSGTDVRWIVLCMRPEEHCPFPGPLDVLAVLGVAPARGAQKKAQNSVLFETTWIPELSDDGELLQHLERSVTGRRSAPSMLRGAEGLVRSLEGVVVHMSGSALALFSLRSPSSGASPSVTRTPPTSLRFECIPVSDTHKSGFDSVARLRDALREVLCEAGDQSPARWIRHVALLPGGDLLLLWQPSKTKRAYSVRELDLRSLAIKGGAATPKQWGARISDWVAAPLSPAAGGKRMGGHAAKRLVGLVHWSKGVDATFLLAVYEEPYDEYPQ